MSVEHGGPSPEDMGLELKPFGIRPTPEGKFEARLPGLEDDKGNIVGWAHVKFDSQEEAAAAAEEAKKKIGWKE